MDKLDIVKEARKCVMRGQMVPKAGVWLEWAGYDLEPGDCCKGCAAGAVLYGWLCAKKEGLEGGLGFEGLCHRLAPEGFSARELSQIDTAFEGRLGDPSYMTYVEALEACRTGNMGEALRGQVQALCWYIEEGMALPDEERCLAILDLMASNGGTFAPHNHSPAQMADILSTYLEGT